METEIVFNDGDRDMFGCTSFNHPLRLLTFGQHVMVRQFNDRMTVATMSGCSEV